MEATENFIPQWPERINRFSYNYVIDLSIQRFARPKKIIS